MKSQGGLGSKFPKIATFALAIRLVAPIGFACQLSDHHQTDAGHAEHGGSDAPQHAHHTGAGHDQTGREASGHTCHDTEDNCNCSLTFIREVQPSRGPEGVELLASNRSIVVAPILLALITDVVADYHPTEVFHPPRSVGVESGDPPRGPPRIV